MLMSVYLSIGASSGPRNWSWMCDLGKMRFHLLVRTSYRVISSWLIPLNRRFASKFTIRLYLSCFWLQSARCVSTHFLTAPNILREFLIKSCPCPLRSRPNLRVCEQQSSQVPSSGSCASSSDEQKFSMSSAWTVRSTVSPEPSERRRRPFGFLPALKL